MPEIEPINNKPNPLFILVALVPAMLGAANVYVWMDINQTYELTIWTHLIYASGITMAFTLVAGIACLAYGMSMKRLPWFLFVLHFIAFMVFITALVFLH